MFDEQTLRRSREGAAQWEAGYRKIVERFGDKAPPRATGAKTQSGLPIKNAYFPHDLEGTDDSLIGAPGAYPFTRGNLPAQYQLMYWVLMSRHRGL